ncbi:S-adenosyl-L-methionine-dependent methyltransferase [Tylopilus felleus]
MRSFNPFPSRPAAGSSTGIFHFSRIQRGDSLPIAMARHQHLLFSQLHLKPGKTVLALSCGNGAIAQQLVQFSDVNVVGIDTDAQLIAKAKVAAEEAGLANRLTYHHAPDICEALEQLPDSSFDAVFAIELGYRTTSLMTLYEHIERLLKPCGRFAIYEWCFTDAMTVANTEHVEAAQNLLRGFPKMAHIDSISTITNLVSTFKAAGLVNVAATDLALRDKNVPWYRPLESHQNSRSNSPLSLSWWYGQLSIATLLTAGRLRIFSPMVLVTGEKSTKCL